MSPTWCAAWEHAHYGPDGFYRRNADPVAHFRTTIMDSAATSQRIFEIALMHYRRLGEPTPFTVLDAGAGGEQLARDVRQLCDHRKLPWQVESLNVPDGDIRDISPRGGAGVVVAHELLDDIPLQVAELDDTLAPRVVQVDPVTGVETLGEIASAADARWLEQWWPATVPGARREVGSTRDALWGTLLNVFDHGCAIAVDYCTTQAERERGVFDAGTLAGYRTGRIVRPVPDGSTNITAHVCVESLVAVGEQRGLPTADVTRPERHSDFHWLVQPI